MFCDALIQIVPSKKKTKSVAKVIDDRPLKKFPLTELNIQCLHEIFNWLRIEDLLKLRRTSWEMKFLVEIYIIRCYPKFGRFRMNNLNYKILCKIDAGSLKLFTKIEMEKTVFQIFGITPDVLFSKMSKALKHIEMVSIDEFNFKSFDIFHVLNYCKNIKCIKITGRAIKRNFKLSSRRYPTLEHVALYVGLFDRHVYGISSIGRFFRENPQIHTFSTYGIHLDEYERRLANAGIKFDQLTISHHEMTDEIFEKLKKLHDKGFYRRLHFYGYKATDEINADYLNIGLEKLCVMGIHCDLPPFPDLKEIRFDYFTHPSNFENVRHSLERIHLRTMHNFNRLEWFICHFPKVKHIGISNVTFKNIYRHIYIYMEGVIDLPALNKKREKLEGACKTTIYAQEDIYLATKSQFDQLTYSMIELKREQTFDWKHEWLEHKGNKNLPRYDGDKSYTTMILKGAITAITSIITLFDMYIALFEFL
ncbi:uncharacterized protein LOC116349706 isoform X1 [Contarinia nasturtii]|uniref:uncharacterized protein LOC116349706 isoform X1 n=1 Tax=Contarinia nasturtii TaxID=265458 RepID=UPI0012D3C355|nr:uncharacterized protein LOC116349706 isoform X1 [Contarinia nasturtii]XP_031637115.1 uncharacterized protein LOC116349706 isoform X1 [Contarinia nasturtii]XP_031637116.1 uncharacterized protein LOC116349706 isoform X1 [Contarinia nasturtii]